MTNSRSDETSVPEKYDKRLFWSLFVAASIVATAAVALLMFPSGDGGGCGGEILWLLSLILLSAGVPLGVLGIAMSPSSLQGWSLAAGLVLVVAWACFEFVVLVFALYVVIVCM